MLKISSFTVEYKNVYLGLDEKKPRFSWILEGEGRNVKQKAFRLKVRDQDNNIVWDTGRIVSEESVLIEYEGVELLPRTEYRIAVSVEDTLCGKADAELSFETGPLDEKLHGKFIACPFGDIVPEFSKKFKLSKKIRRARIYATALGLYELFLNGKRVGDVYDAPGWTSYNHRLQYQTYDVTAMLGKDNELSALVAKGWYSGTIGYFHRKNCYGDRNALCLDLFIDFEDGTQKIVSTDEGWQARESGLRASEFQDGEIYDCTFTAEKYFPVNIVEYDKSKLVGQICEPVRVTEVLSVQNIIVTPKGECVLDFGQNSSGVVEFTVQGDYGQRIKISHAEVLDEEGNFYTANLRGAKSEDIYILNGKKQILKPHFTTHGFRYIKVEGIERVNPNDFRLLVLHTDMERTGEFHCENPLVEKLQKNIVWGQRGNFLDIPTDCPQRDERLGWTGDAQVFCRTAAFNYNIAPFFVKWLGDLYAEQTQKDGVSQTVPNIIPGNEKGAAAWGDAATICPWTIYEVYGDKRILERQYESMKGWVEYIRARSENDLWTSDFQYGDWLALDKEEFSDRTGATDKYFIASAYYAYSTKLTAKAARILGKDKEAEEYEELHRRIVLSFQKEYMTERGRLVSETQTAFVLALGFNLVPERFRTEISDRLRKNLEDHGNHLVTGFVGTPYLCHVLSENGMHDLAQTLLLNEDYPSWLYEVKKGATTIWERWNAIQPDGKLYNPGMSSFNHYAYGSIGDWLYRKVAGIDCLEAGYKKIRIKPYPVRELGAVYAKFKTSYGLISVAYSYAKEKIFWKICIPANTEALIELPDGQKYSVGSGEYNYETKDIKKTDFIDGLHHTLKEAFSDVQCMQIISRILDKDCISEFIESRKECTLKEFLNLFPDSKAAVKQIADILEEKKDV